jgi:hypothetical protein
MTTDISNPTTSELGETTPSVETVRALIAAHNSWGRWGSGDQVGTLKSNLLRLAHPLRANLTSRSSPTGCSGREPRTRGVK